MINKDKSILSYLFLFVTYTITAIIYNLCNEHLSLIPLRIVAVLINGIGITFFTVFLIELIKKTLKVNLYTFIIGINMILVEIELFLLLNFYTIITPSIVSVINETNSSEINEFIHSYFDIKTIIILIIPIFVSYIIFKYRNYINKKIQFTKHISRTKLIIISIVLLSCYVIFNIYVKNVRKMISYQTLTSIERVYYSLKDISEDDALYNEYLQKIQKPAPQLISNKSNIDNIVLILGESLSKIHMNLYGYYLNTTPNLNRRLLNNELIKFENVVTPKTITSLAIREILTFYNGEKDNPWYNHYTIMDVLKEAGYITSWISNQESFNIGDNNSTAAIASTANNIKFTHYKHATEERYGYFDGDLIEILNEITIKNRNEKSFYCLHLMGNHRRYTNRYPNSFNKFEQADIKKNVNIINKGTIAEYDNSVLYNDYVVDQIFRIFEQKDAIVFYFPDHGEEVYDTRNMFGHELYNPSSAMKNIPFVIWTSSIFKKRHNEVQKRLLKATNKELNTKNFIHSILDLCNIDLKEYVPTQSFFYEKNK